MRRARRPTLRAVYIAPDHLSWKVRPRSLAQMPRTREEGAAEECQLSKKLYVGNLAFSTTEDELRAAFGKHGRVESVNVIMDRDTGRPRGFGFVEMDEASTADAAMRALDGEQSRRPRPQGQRSERAGSRRRRRRRRQRPLLGRVQQGGCARCLGAPFVFSGSQEPAGAMTTQSAEGDPPTRCDRLTLTRARVRCRAVREPAAQQNPALAPILDTIDPPSLGCCALPALRTGAPARSETRGKTD